MNSDKICTWKFAWMLCWSDLRAMSRIYWTWTWTWPRVVSQAPGQSSAGQGYNVCTFDSCFTSCLWPTLPQVQDWLAALDLGPRKDATPSFLHSFPPKLPQSACPGERRPTCSALCSSSWTMTDRRHLWIISIAGHYPIRTIRWPRDTE